MQRKDDQWTDVNPNAAAAGGQDAGLGAPDQAGLDPSFAGSKPGQDMSRQSGFDRQDADTGLSGQDQTSMSSADQTDMSFAGSKPGRSETAGQSLTDDQRRALELGRAAMRALIGGSDEE